MSEPVRLEGQTQICEGGHTTLQLQSDHDFEVLEWRRNGEKIEGQNLKFLEVSESGAYRALIRYLNACISESSTLELTVVPLPSGEINQIGSQLLAPEGAISYQWYRNGNLLEGENFRILELKQTGSYKVVLENSLGCSVILPALKITVSGLFSRIIFNELMIYPNPASKQLNVKIPNDSMAKITSFEVYSVDGKKLTSVLHVIRKNETEFMLEVENLSPGIYFIWLKDEIGKAYMGRFSKTN